MLKYQAQINRGFGWVTIGESDLFVSARNIATDYAIEHDCDWRTPTEAKGEETMQKLTETELKIMAAALPVVEAVPAAQDSCWPGDGPAHDDECTNTDHAASIAAVAATEGLSWEFYTWSSTVSWFRLALGKR